MVKPVKPRTTRASAKAILASERLKHDLTDPKKRKERADEARAATAAAKKAAVTKEPDSLAAETEQPSTKPVVTPMKGPSPGITTSKIYEAINGSVRKVFTGADAETECIRFFEEFPDAIVMQHDSLDAMVESQAKEREYKKTQELLQAHLSAQANLSMDEKHADAKAGGSEATPMNQNMAEASVANNDENQKVYVVKHGGDTRIFAGDDAQKNLVQFLTEYPGGVIEHHDSFKAYQVSMAMEQESTSNNQADGVDKKIDQPSEYGYTTPPAKSSCTVESTSVPFGSAAAGSGIVTSGKTTGLESFHTLPELPVPDFGKLMNAESSLYGPSKIEIIVSMTSFLSVSNNQEQGVVFFNFASGKGDEPKPYWAMKPHLMGSLLGALDETGHFKGDNMLPDGVFKDIHVAQLRSTPYGSNEGQRSKKGSEYSVNIMYVIVKRNKGSLVSSGDVVRRIGERVQGIVSADWFRDIYIQYAENHVSSYFAETLKKPKEKFFTLLKNSSLSFKENISLNHYLLDDDIFEYVKSSFGFANIGASWPTQLKHMAFKDGIFPDTKDKKEGSKTK